MCKQFSEVEHVDEIVKLLDFLTESSLDEKIPSRQLECIVYDFIQPNGKEVEIPTVLNIFYPRVIANSWIYINQKEKKVEETFLDEWDAW